MPHAAAVRLATRVTRQTELGLITQRTKWAVAGVGILLGAMTSAARADGPATAPAPPATAPAATVDNPQYALWSTFRPGSSATMAGDLDAGAMGKVHLEVTQTLQSVAPDAITLSQATRLTLSGQPQPARPPAKQVIPAKQAAADMTPAGTADVQALGKTFSCRVYDVGRAGGGPKGTAYVASGVPGGVVKLVLVGPNGRSLTFVLSATDVK